MPRRSSFLPISSPSLGRLRPYALFWGILSIAVAEAHAQEAAPPGETAPPEEAAPQAEEEPAQTPASPQEESQDSPPTENQPAVVPPGALFHPEAVYPAEEEGHTHEVTVVIQVIVEKNGHVGALEVTQSGGPRFDAAALEALRRWRFSPALRNGEPIAAKILVPFHFHAPEEQEPQKSAPEETPPTESLVESGEAEPPPQEIVVLGRRHLRLSERTASDYVIERDVLEWSPRSEGAEVLRSVPGLSISRAEGPAVGHRYSLRGFDSDHGQDIAFSVGGIPINLPSHIHGQGYADLGFLIEGTTSEVSAKEGVSDPIQGDFAVAGSVDVLLGVKDRGVSLKAGYGSFQTFEGFAIYAPEDSPEESFGAAHFLTTDGYGENRGGKNGSAIFQHRFGTQERSYRVIGIATAARFDQAGVLRRDDIGDESDETCFHCVYPYATARGQNAEEQRVLVGFFGDHQKSAGENSEYGAWLSLDQFRMQQNYTGFIERSQTLENVSGRGDLLAQENRTLSFGLKGRHQTRAYEPTSWARGRVEIGTDSRVDWIDQDAELIDASARNQIYDKRVDSQISSIDVGLYGDVDFSLFSQLYLRVGARADLLSYSVRDSLANRVPLARPQDQSIPGYNRSASGLFFGPRSSLEYRPLHYLSFSLAYGEGFRSPQARTLEDGEKTPFAKVRTADAGMRLDFGDPLRLQFSGFYTHLSDDVAFEPSEGSLERIGPTRRLGVAAYLQSRPAPWLLTALSITYVDATLLSPPPRTAQEPDPPYVRGQSLSYVAPITARLDVGIRKPLPWRIGESPLGVTAGSGFSYLSPRPLPYGEQASSVGLLDASVGLYWKKVDLSLDFFNLLNQDYATMEYAYASDWDPNDNYRSRVPARHLSAGAPLSWMLNLGVRL